MITPEFLAELRAKAVAAIPPLVGNMVSQQEQSTLLPKNMDAAMVFRRATHAHAVIELIDALKAQDREAERIGRQIISDSDAFVAIREQRDQLRAELAAIRAQVLAANQRLAEKVEAQGREMLARQASHDALFIRMRDAEVERDALQARLEQPAEPAPKRPINCGTGHCSCIECVVEPAPPVCKCSMRTKLVGDGCDVCNPELAADMREPAPSTAVEREKMVTPYITQEQFDRVFPDISQSTALPVPFQERVNPWLLACFGQEIADDTQERNHRFLEESLELVQACGCTPSEAHQLVDYVYGRPVGEKTQEVGGVMVTLAALCLAQRIDMHQCGEVELARIWTKVEKIRAKQAAKPKHSPLPEHVAALPVGELTDEQIAAAWHDNSFVSDYYPNGYTLKEHVLRVGRAILAAARPQPVLEPLTERQLYDGQWADGSGSSADFREGARFAESHHGITQGGKP